MPGINPQCILQSVYPSIYPSSLQPTPSQPEAHPLMDIETTQAPPWTMDKPASSSATSKTQARNWELRDLKDLIPIWGPAPKRLTTASRLIQAHCPADIAMGPQQRLVTMPRKDHSAEEMCLTVTKGPGARGRACHCTRICPTSSPRTGLLKSSTPTMPWVG